MYLSSKVMFVLIAEAFVISLNSNALNQIHLALTTDPSEMVITWASASPQKGSVYVVAQRSINTQRIQEMDEPSRYKVKEYTSPYIHRVTLTGLVGDTRYVYTVIDGEKSVQSTFLTRSFTPKPVSIAVIGDHNYNPYAIATSKAILKDETSPNLILHVGDLSYADKHYSKWDTYFETHEFLSRRIPWMVCPGNHENQDNFIAYQKLYSMPSVQSGAKQGNHYWSMDYSWMHIVMLSTELKHSENSAQHKWLVKDLAAVDRTKTPWLVVGFHRPIYNSNHEHQCQLETKCFQKAYEKVFKQYGVDFALTAHVHAYERTSQVYNGELNKDGPQYFVIGTAGNVLDTTWKDKPVWSEVRTSKYGYGRLQIVNQTHAHWDWMVNGIDNSTTDREVSDVGDSTWIVRTFPRSYTNERSAPRKKFFFEFLCGLTH